MTGEKATTPNALPKMKYLASVTAYLALSGWGWAATIAISQPAFTGMPDLPPIGFGQSFTATSSDSLTAIHLYVSSCSGGSDFTLRLYDFDSDGSKLGASILGSGTFLETDLSTTAGWRSVALTSAVKVIEGQTYAFTVIAKDPGGSATGWNNYGRHATDIYAGGNYLGLGSNGAVTKQAPDLAFQIFSVPEPGGVLLAGASLVTAVIRRTRR